VLRRLHTPRLSVGEIPLDSAQARHARDVLRLTDGTVVELFDDAGAVATGTLILHGAHEALVRVEQVEQASAGALRLTVASAVPKGERADWMVEKLSELGVAEFIPLATERSVVKPEGKNKYERWVRIATESAKQSRRVGVMRIADLTPLAKLLAHPPESICYLSTEPNARPILETIRAFPESCTLLVGPEGGWSPGELELLEKSNAMGARLTQTVLRVETAAIAGAAAALILSAG